MKFLKWKLVTKNIRVKFFWVSNSDSSVGNKSDNSYSDSNMSAISDNTGMDKPKIKSELELELFSSKFFFGAGAGAF